MEEYNYRIQYSHPGLFSVGKTVLNLEEFIDAINESKKDFIIIRDDNTAINKKNISYIEFKKIK